MEEKNLLSLSYGRIVKRDIEATGGLLPASFETYQVIRPNDIVFRFTDLQNDKRSLRSAISRETGIITSAYVAASPKGIDPQYLSFLLRSYDTSKVFYGMGGGIRQSLRFDDVKRLPVLLPSAEEQRTIADYLDRETARIDKVIEKQEKLMKTLSERRVAVAELALDDFPKFAPLKMVTKLVQTGPFGSQLNSAEYQSGGVPVVNPSHISAAGIVANPDVAVSPEKAADLSRHAFRIDDLVVGRRGELGRAAVVTRNEEDFLCGTGSILVRPDIDRVRPQFLKLTIGSTRSREALSLASVGSTMENLNASIIGSLGVPAAPLEEQDECLRKLDLEIKRIDKLNTAVRQFIELTKERRSALITAAVTGQIDVREVA